MRLGTCFLGVAKELGGHGREHCEEEGWGKIQVPPF